jgi:YggT family protein
VSVICFLLWLWMLAVILRIAMSWFPSPSGGQGTVTAFLDAITEPVLGPLRRVLPPVRLGAAALDLSPIVVLFGLSLILRVLC